MAQMIGAINREICFSSFWFGTEYKLGSTVTAFVADRGSTAVVGIDGLLRDNKKFFSEFYIKYIDGSAFVESTKSASYQYFKIINDKDSYKYEFRTTSKCRHYRPTTSHRLLLIEMITRTELSNPLFAAKNAKSAIVANVDEAYPTSLIYMPHTNRLFTIYIRPGADENAVRNGDYNFGELYNKYLISSIKTKLFRYGIEISLST